MLYPAPPPAGGVGLLLLFFVGATIPVAALINVLTGCASWRYLAGRAPRAGQHRRSRDHPDTRNSAPLGVAPCRRSRLAFARIRARVTTPAAPRWPPTLAASACWFSSISGRGDPRRFTFGRRGPAVTQAGRARRPPRRRIRNRTRASAQPRFWRPAFVLRRCPWWPSVRKDPLGRCEGAPRVSMRVAADRQCCARVWSFFGASSKCALRAP